MYVPSCLHPSRCHPDGNLYATRLPIVFENRSAGAVLCATEVPPPMLLTVLLSAASVRDIKAYIYQTSAWETNVSDYAPSKPFTPYDALAKRPTAKAVGGALLGR